MSVLDRLKELTPHLYRLRVLVITAAIVVVAFLVNYLFYVRHQTDYFTDRNFRRLSLVGSQITAKVETAGVVLKNNSDKFINPTKPGVGRRDFSVAREKDNLNDFKELFTTFTDDGPEITPVSIRIESLSDKTSPGTVSLTAVREEGDSSWLYLDYVSDVIAPKKIVRVQGKVDLNSLVHPFMSFSSSTGLEKGQFENILISEADSAKVIFQNDATQIRLAALDKLSATDDSGKSIDIKKVGKTSSVADVALAGSDYKLFSQPVTFSLSGIANAPSTAWIVSGLIRADDFRSEVWSISYNKLIIFGSIAMLLVLSWPFFKLVLTGQKDRLRTADIYFLVFATIVGIAMLTSLAFYRYLYTSAEVELNKQLGSLADNIRGNFHEELDAALEQLDAFSKNCALLKRLGSEVEKCKDAKEKPIPQHAARNNTKQHATTDQSDPYQQAALEKTDVLSELWELPKTTYPYFDTAVWLDTTGRQQAKWTIKSNTTQYINVSRRDYFRNIRLGHHYEINGTKFWLEPIVSRTTGRNEVEISKATIDPNWIAAFDTQLISLMHPVLPESFGFAVVANDGKVLFHSDEAHNLGENFFQECDDNPALRAEVIGRTGEPLNVRYLGQDHSLLVTTIPGFPDWSLLVFRNKQPLRAAFLALISLVSCLFLSYTILLLTGFSIFYLQNVNNERRAWLWPSEKKTEIYFQSLLILLGLSVLAVALAIRLHGQYLVWVSALIGMVSALAFFAILFLGNTRFWPEFLKKVFHYPAKLANHHLLFVLNVTFLLVVIAILPAAAFFKYAYETEMRLFIKQAQFTFVDALGRRDERIRNQYANIKTVAKSDSDKSSQSSNPGLSEFTKQRLNKVNWDIYDSFFYGTEHSQLAVRNETCIRDLPSETLANLTSYLPFPLRNSIRRQALSASTVVGGVCKWEAGANGKLVLHLDSNASAEIGRPWQHLITNVPQAKGPTLFWFVIFVLFFPLFLWFMYFILRKVFLLDVHKPTSSPLGEFLTTKIERNVFVVVDAPFTEKKTSSPSNLCLKDLRTIVPAADGSYKLTDLPGGDQAIGLDNFDCNLNDSQSNVKKLDLLENLLDEKRTLMIFSSVEPSQYRFKNGANGHENGGSDQDGRWAEIISQFFTDYAEDTGDPEQFTKEIEQERARILSLDLKGRSVKEVNELIDTVETECKPKGPLQHIGRQILAGDDFITLSRQHLLKRIVNQARTYYTHLWNSCSINEKLTLSHLATDRLLNYRDPDTEKLLRRELIVRDDDVHLMNDSFREFVLSVDQMALVREHDHAGKHGSSWQSLRGPLLVVMIAFVGFLFMTQRDFYMSSLALITAVTTIIPAVFKLLSLFQGDPLRRPPAQP